MKKKSLIIVGIIILIVLGFLIFNRKKEPIISPNVVSTFPKNNAMYVDEKSEIIIELDKDISLEDGNLIKVKIEPEVKWNSVYQQNKIRISPETNFDFGIKYKVSLFFSDSFIYSFEFTTTSVTPEQLVNDAKLQSEADIAYNDTTNNFIEKNPWYTKLPIETSDYRIVYDYEKEMFRIRFLKEQNVKTEIDKLVTEALKKLELAGATKPIKYYVLQPNDDY